MCVYIYYYMYVYNDIYLSIYLSISLSLSIYIYIYSFGRALLRIQPPHLPPRRLRSRAGSRHEPTNEEREQFSDSRSSAETHPSESEMDLAWREGTNSVQSMRTYVEAMFKQTTKPFVPATCL